MVFLLHQVINFDVVYEAVLHTVLIMYILHLFPIKFVWILLCLPSGNFGDVYKATLETPNGRGVEVAVKSINRHSTEKERKDFIMEMVAMTTMLHPNIVYLHGLVLEGKSNHATKMLC